jgi:hypothetical protein
VFLRPSTLYHRKAQARKSEVRARAKNLDKSGSIKKSHAAVSATSLHIESFSSTGLHKNISYIAFSSTSLLIVFLFISKEPILIVFLLISKQHRKQSNAADAPFPTKQNNATEEMKGVMPPRPFMVRGPGGRCRRHSSLGWWRCGLH